MSRVVTLLAVFFVIFTVFPQKASAQPTPELLLDGRAEHIEVFWSTYIDVETEPGALFSRFTDAACTVLDTTLTPPRNTYNYTRTHTVTEYFQAYWESDPSTTSACLSISWKEELPATPPLSLDDQENDIIVFTDHTVSIYTHHLAQINSYQSEDCTGSVSSSVQHSMSAHAVSVTHYSYQAHWLHDPSVTSPCRVAYWVNPPRESPPPLTLNGGTENIVLTGTQSFEFQTDAAAEIVLYQALNCSGTPIQTSPYSVGFVAAAPNQYSAQAQWVGDTALKSPCLTVEFVLPIPPLTVNGVSTNLSLDVGDTAVFLTDSGAEIVLFETNDCSGTPLSTTVETVSHTAASEGAMSARSHWIGWTDVTSSCLLVNWTATATMTPTSAPTETTDSGTESVLPTSPSGASTVDSSLSGKSQSGKITGLPSTGSGPEIGTLATSLVALVAIILVAAGSRISRDH